MKTSRWLEVSMKTWTSAHEPLNCRWDLVRATCRSQWVPVKRVAMWPVSENVAAIRTDINDTNVLLCCLLRFLPVQDKQVVRPLDSIILSPTSLVSVTLYQTHTPSSTVSLLWVNVHVFKKKRRFRIRITNMTNLRHRASSNYFGPIGNVMALSTPQPQSHSPNNSNRQQLQWWRNCKHHWGHF